MKCQLQHIAHALLFVLTACVMLTSCQHDDDDDEAYPSVTHAKRTVVFYMVAENNLYQNLSADVNEILAAASELDDSCRVLLYVDDTKVPRFYTIDNSTKEQSFSKLTPDYTFPEDFNSCSGENMQRVLNIIRQYYPSDSYGMVFWSHGTGWLPSTYSGDYTSGAPVRRSYGLDGGSNSQSSRGYQMSVSTMASVLKTFPHLDFIFFDVCYMQCIEVAYALRGCADYVIASPAEIPAKGAPYTSILHDMFCSPVSYQSLIDTYYNMYVGWHDSYFEQGTGVSLSAIRCDALDSLHTVTKNMLRPYAGALTSNLSDVSIYLNIYNEFLNYQFIMYDIEDYMHTMLTDSEYAEWLKTLNSAVVYSRSSKILFSEDNGNKTIDTDHACAVSMSVDPSLYTSNSKVVGEYDALGWKVMGE